MRGLEGCDEDGNKKGNAPEGEAWLFEGTISNSMPAIFNTVYRISVSNFQVDSPGERTKHTCHFKHEGL